jgi:uncharacterized protein VirK/YbjX
MKLLSMKLFTAIKLLRRSKQPPTPFETVKYLLRGLFSPVSHSAWNRYLLASPVGQARVQAQPQLVWKLQRSYLSRGTNVQCKLEWLRQHHDWVARHWPADQVAQVYLPGGLVLAELPLAPGEVSYQLQLCMDAQFAKEGELVLSLWRCEPALDGPTRDRVAALAFAIHKHHGEWVAHVGCLQGGSGSDTADLIRQATRELHGLRPKQAVVIALYAITAAYELDHVRAVTRSDHVYQSHWRRRARVQADYDAYWAELGGVADGSAWRLPAHLSRKAVEDIASKKRSQYRRRHALEDQLTDQVRAAIKPDSNSASAPQA